MGVWVWAGGSMGGGRVAGLVGWGADAEGAPEAAVMGWGAPVPIVGVSAPRPSMVPMPMTGGGPPRPMTGRGGAPLSEVRRAGGGGAVGVITR